ncbi:MAG: M1 family aminopeptidase [Cyanobacteria bacterium P01_F01_bin.116]
MINRLLLILIILFNINSVHAKSSVDFIEYVAELKPDFIKHTLKGKVKIHFKMHLNAMSNKDSNSHYAANPTLILSAENMDILQVKGDWVKAHTLKEGRLHVSLYKDKVKTNVGRVTSIEVDYLAKPQRGLKFFSNYLYTLFHTEQWLVSHFNIADKAKFDLTLFLPSSMKVVANGNAISSIKEGQWTRHHWRESRDRPLFTLGFAAGDFKEKWLKHNQMRFRVLYKELKENEIERIFRDLGQAYDFFYKLSGKQLSQQHYTFVITPENSMQEASGFSLVGRDYLSHVLSEPRESWLMTHELAHEWWGNSISAASWNDFWLNEGLVQFLVAAFKEKAYGRDEYDREIIFFKESILRHLKENKGRLPAVSPVQPIDLALFKTKYRGVAYSKGAFIFHMLRQELGDSDFWQGLKLYSQKYWEKAVSTTDLKKSFERASGKNLDDFFNTWVYEEQHIDAKIDFKLKSFNFYVQQQQEEVKNFDLWIDFVGKNDVQTVKFSITKKMHNFQYELPFKPIGLRIDSKHILPFWIEVKGADEWLAGGLQHTKTALDKYWAMKSLLNSSACQKKPAFIHQHLKMFDSSDNPRILQSAFSWWRKRCL